MRRRKNACMIENSLLHMVRSWALHGLKHASFAKATLPVAPPCSWLGSLPGLASFHL